MPPKFLSMKLLTFVLISNSPKLPSVANLDAIPSIKKYKSRLEWKSSFISFSLLNKILYSLIHVFYTIQFIKFF